MPDRLTDEDLREALMLDGESDAAPWYADDYRLYLHGDGYSSNSIPWAEFKQDDVDSRNGVLIARYRNDYPAAASELLRLREGLHVLVDVMRPSDRLPRGIVDTDRSGPSPRLSLEAIVHNLLAGRAWDDDGEGRS